MIQRRQTDEKEGFFKDDSWWWKDDCEALDSLPWLSSRRPLQRGSGLGVRGPGHGVEALDG